MLFYKIGLNINLMKSEGTLLKLNSSRESVYQDLARIMEYETLDFQDYSEELVMIVDGNGYFNKNYLVFQIVTQYGDTIELAGSIIFAKNIETEDSTDIGPISEEEILILRDKLNIKLIGITRGI
ncbi:hypothetical protein [Lysinibacillus capsici]|uniref:hypothetical protein n=1 Tax=Lysinibacillus capsici TaxID=2115968 RepID=UPI0027AAC37A|nr:hypothetical protein QIX46_23675 [Lysinibacillus boronitolerans]